MTIAARARRSPGAWCCSTTALRDALPLLFDFLGVADPQRPAPRLDPEARQRQIIAVMRQVIQSVSEEQPTVTLIEDLHWLDDASGEFLAHMVDARAGSRNLLLLNFRPEYHADWMQKSWYRQIPLTPLGREAIAELLADLLGTDPSIAALAGPIHARTGGNPFFTEEVAQTLIESGHLARRARRLPAGDADRAARGAGHRAGGAGGAHRSAAGAREAAAASRRR